MHAIASYLQWFFEFMTTTQITSPMAKYEIVLFGNLILEIKENMSKKLRLINYRISDGIGI